MPKSKSKEISSKSLKDTLKDINLHFEKESVAVQRNENGRSRRVILTSMPSTGSLGLDIALGIGGIPKGELQKYTDQNHLERQR